MDTSNLSQLEGSVAKLLAKFQSLQKENRQLQLDKDSLVEKNKLAADKIEAMISKLKEMG